MINHFKIIKEAIRAVPFVKYALGLAGIVSVIALVGMFNISFKTGVIGVIIVLVLMAILFLLAKSSQNQPNFFNGPVLFLIWGIVTLFIGTAGLLVSSIFFKKPQNLSDWINTPKTEHTQYSESETKVKDSVIDSTYNAPPKVLTVKGHVRWEDHTPIFEAVVIPSLYHIKSLLSEANGSFTFQVNENDLSDSIVLSVRSFQIKGTKNKKFGKNQITTDCEVIIRLADKLSFAKVRKNNLDKNDPQLVFAKLIKPIEVYLDSSKKVNKPHITQFTFEEAQKLYWVNKKMEKLISTNSNLIPGDLDKDFNTLYQHINIVTSNFERKWVGAKNLSGRDSFALMQANLQDYPVQSVNKILEYKTKERLQ